LSSWFWEREHNPFKEEGEKGSLRQTDVPKENEGEKNLDLTKAGQVWRGKKIDQTRQRCGDLE